MEHCSALPRASCRLRRVTRLRDGCCARARRRVRCRLDVTAAPAAARASSSEPTRTRSSGATRSRRRRSPARSACARSGSRSSGSRADAGSGRLPARARQRLALDSCGHPRRRQRLRPRRGRAAHDGRPRASTARSSPTCSATTPRSTTSRSGTTRTTARSGRRSSTPDGASVAPADYEALLAPVLRRGARRPHERERDRGRRLEELVDTPGAFTLAWHPPAAWFAKLAAAYRASRRTKPIFDTLGYIPHPASSAERPWTKHPGASAISLGDYATLMQTLTTAFRGTAQPVPGQGIDEDLVPRAGLPDRARPGPHRASPAPRPTRPRCRRGRRRRRPTAARAPASTSRCSSRTRSASRTASRPSARTSTSTSTTSATSPGWQSGVFWPDGQPKAAYQALQQRRRRASTRARSTARRSSVGRRPAAAGRRARMPAQQQLRDHGPARDLGRRLRRDRHLADVDPGQRRRSPTASSTSASRPSGRRSATDGDGQVASLIALDSSSAYRVWVNAVSDDGQRAQATLDFTTPGLPAAPDAGDRPPGRRRDARRACRTSR